MQFNLPICRVPLIDAIQALFQAPYVSKETPPVASSPHRASSGKLQLAKEPSPAANQIHSIDLPPILHLIAEWR